MRRLTSKSLVMLFALCLAGNLALAGQFDPLFRVTKVSGDCQVLAPGDQAYSPAMESKAYPYGSKLKTGKKSSMVVMLSRGNSFRVLADAAFTMTQDPKNHKLRKVKLDEGRIEVELEKNLKETHGNEFHVETATAVCAAVGTIFTVEVRTENELKIAVIVCKEGEIKVFGDHFEIPSMGANCWISLSSSRDRKFLRLKNGQGRYKINYKDSDGNPRTSDFQMGSVIKIWQRDSDSGDSIIVTILIAAPDESLKETQTYVQARPQSADEGDDSLPPEEVILRAGEEDQGQPQNQNQNQGQDRNRDEEGWEIITTTTTTSTSTTTTTLPPSDEVITTTTTTTSTTQPSPTPVGKR